MSNCIPMMASATINPGLTKSGLSESHFHSSHSLPPRDNKDRQVLSFDSTAQFRDTEEFEGNEDSGSDADSEIITHSPLDPGYSVSSQDSYPDLCNSGDEQEQRDMILGGYKRFGEPLIGRLKKRRKQSNPVRIASTVAELAALNHPPLEELQSFDDQDGSRIMGLRCPHCKDVLETESDLRHHLEEKHNPATVKGKSKNAELPLDLSHAKESPISSPSPGQLGTSVAPPPSASPSSTTSVSDLSKSRMPHSNLLPFGANPFIFPFLAQTSPGLTQSHIPQPGSSNGGTVNGNSGPPVRIFNPEAYCEICNKEFCNKYFLKTHKANKHGIYQPEVSSASQSPSVSGSQYAGAFMTANVPWPKSNRSSENNCSPQASPPLSLGYPASLMSPNALNQFFMRPLPPQTIKSKGSSKSEGSVSMKSNGFNLEAYCELCQKVFCNKYFLKRHKSKIHGIISEKSSSPILKSDLTPSFISTLAGSQMKGQEEVTSLCCDSSKTSSSSSSFIVCNLCKAEFENQNEFDKHLFSVHGLLADSPYSMMSATSHHQTVDTKQEIEEREEVKYEQGEISKGSLSMSTEAQACTLCSKLFQSVKHLNIHLSKKHNISIETLDPDENKESIDSAAKDGQSESGSTDAESNKELSCEFCGRPFLSSYLLQMHKHYFHSSSDTSEGDFMNQGTPPEGRNEEIKEEDCKSEQMKTGKGDDLQRLQTMIMELNNGQKDIKVKDIDDKGMLKQCEDDTGISTQYLSHFMADTKCMTSPSKQSSPSGAMNNAEITFFCQICKKEFLSKIYLQQHLQSVHGMPCATGPAPNTFGFYERMRMELERLSSGEGKRSSSESRQPVSTSRSYCEICNKELCNKYFMKTHMLKMHGINLENGNMLGGVTCDVCNKELCSKYFLKVHKQNTHGIFDEGAGLATPTGEPDPALIPSSEANDVNNRYFTHFTEVCPICNRRFKSVKWLKAHLENDHGDTGMHHWREIEKVQAEKQTATEGTKCQFCNLLVADQVALHVHIIKCHASQTSAGTKSSHKATKEREERKCESVPSAKKSPLAYPSSNKPYHCRYCPYTSMTLHQTLSHEKGHLSMGLGLGFGMGFQNLFQPGKMQCLWCPQQCEDITDFQQHILTHQLSHHLATVMSAGLTNPLVNGMEKMEPLQEPIDDAKDDVNKEKDVKKYKCPQCLKRFSSRESCLAHFHSKHNPRRSAKTNRAYKCKKCGFTSKNRSILKVHIRRHSTPIRKDISVSNGCDSKQFPITYGVPQTPMPPGSFMMQPFLLKPEPQGSDEHPDLKNFVTSLVYLPVSRRISNTVTIAFSLTPAQ